MYVVQVSKKYIFIIYTHPTSLYIHKLNITSRMLWNFITIITFVRNLSLDFEWRTWRRNSQLQITLNVLIVRDPGHNAERGIPFDPQQGKNASLQYAKRTATQYVYDVVAIHE